MSELIKKEFVEETIEKGRKTYSATTKGKKYLSEYHHMIHFIDSFGLD